MTPPLVCVVDASVAIKLYLAEPLASQNDFGRVHWLVAGLDPEPGHVTISPSRENLARSFIRSARRLPDLNCCCKRREILQAAENDGRNKKPRSRNQRCRPLTVAPETAGLNQT